MKVGVFDSAFRMPVVRHNLMAVRVIIELICIPQGVDAIPFLPSDDFVAL
jgi:hypothetical protein